MSTEHYSTSERTTGHCVTQTSRTYVLMTNDLTPIPCRVQMAPDEYRAHINQSVAREKMYADQHTRGIAPLLNGQQLHVLKHEKKE